MDFIFGADVIYSEYGYWPSFHDDYIDEIRISGENIALLINTVTKPHNEMNKEYKIMLTFQKVKIFDFEGELYGRCSLILDMKFVKRDDEIEMTLYSSLGTSGRIVCQSVSVKKL